MRFRAAPTRVLAHAAYRRISPPIVLIITATICATSACRTSRRIPLRTNTHIDDHSRMLTQCGQVRDLEHRRWVAGVGMTTAGESQRASTSAHQRCVRTQKRQIHRSDNRSPCVDVVVPALNSCGPQSIADRGTNRRSFESTFDEYQRPMGVPRRGVYSAVLMAINTHPELMITDTD